MTPRLVGPTVALHPLPAEVAAAAPEPAALRAAVAAAGLAAADGWPHEDTAGALLTAAGDHARAWLVVVDGEVVGECGWKGPPDGDGAVEVGYGLAAAARGRGTGTEAVGLLVAWTEQQPGVRAVTAEVLAGNEASLRLLRRLGFEERPRGGHVLAVRGRLPVRGRHVC